LAQREVAELAILHGRKEEIVEDEYVDAGEPRERGGVCTIGAGDRKIVDETWDAGEERAVAP